MGIQSLGLLSGASLSASGGTAFTLTAANGGVPGQIYVSDSAVTDPRLRPSAVFKASIPVQQKDGQFSKDRRNASFVVPLYDPTSLKYENGVIRIERVMPAFATPAQALHMNFVAAQIAFNAAAAAFWATGSYA